MYNPVLLEYIFYTTALFFGAMAFDSKSFMAIFGCIAVVATIMSIVDSYLYITDKIKSALSFMTTPEDYNDDNW